MAQLRGKLEVIERDRRLRRERRVDLPTVAVVGFGLSLSCGEDLDPASLVKTLRIIAESTGGQIREGDPETIRDLYKILSTYF